MLNIEKILNEPLIPEEAIKYFKGKIPVTSKEFKEIIGVYKTKAFTVANYTSIEIIKRFQEELEKALEEGTTSKEFKKRIDEFLEQAGYKGLTPFRADVIFRTNTQTAYAVGHYKQMTKPHVVKARPYWMYDAVNDSRTRPTHLAMDGVVYPAGHEFWDFWYPPNGYRCRCGVRTLSERQVKAMGLTVEDEIPDFIEPDRGFATNPAKKAWEPDLSKYPEVLRKAFEKRQKISTG